MKRVIKLVESENNQELYYSVDEHLSDAYNELLEYHKSHLNDTTVQGIIEKLESIFEELKNHFNN